MENYEKNHNSIIVIAIFHLNDYFSHIGQPIIIVSLPIPLRVVYRKVANRDFPFLDAIKIR